jgi:hypothetical protein
MESLRAAGLHRETFKKPLNKQIYKNQRGEMAGGLAEATDSNGETEV